MKRISFKLLIMFFALSFCLLLAGEKSNAADEVSNLKQEIETLKLVNVLELSKEQIQKILPILKDGQKKKIATLKEIKASLIKGVKYGELQGLDKRAKKENKELLDQINNILTPEQLRKAQLLIQIIPDEELAELKKLGPIIAKIFSERRQLNKELGVTALSDVVLNELFLSLGKAGGEVYNLISDYVSEAIVEKLISPTAIQALEGKLKAMK